ncbi:putative membrane protein [Candidatus Paraburkholderia calva]|nr:putative membrane protein [Candidatus Paraburkholderia calva]
MRSTLSVERHESSSLRTAKLFFYAAIILLIAEFIGSFTFKISPGKVILLPMIWALLLGAALELASERWKSGARLDVRSQFYAAAILQPALLLFVSKLGLMVGSALPKLAVAGWALAFQELGHFVGTMLLGLPLALLLGIKREAIGATFSVGREPSLAIIGEKYGMDFAEGRGVLPEYLTGTVFGAVFIAIFAGFVASLNIFHPLALAMGSGVGSGSMMAAASGAIAAQQDPETAKSVLTFAAASNLITTTVGTYFTLFISLPMALFGYRVLEPIIGRKTKASAASDTAASAPRLGDVKTEAPELGYGGKLLAWAATAIMVLMADWITHGTTPMHGLPGVLIMVVATMIGDAIAQVTGRKIPAVYWVSIVAMFLICHGVRGARRSLKSAR